MRDPSQVLLRPVVSEKSYALMDDGVYVFVVAPDSTQIEVRMAVEQAFGVRVSKVNTLNRKGKVRHNRKTNTRGQAAGDQARRGDAARRRPHRPVREELRGLSCRCASASRPVPADASRVPPTSRRSPGRGPEKSLLGPKPRTGGRNSYGRKTARHRGGGHKQQYRIIDFKRDKDGVPAKVATDRVRPQPQCPHRLAALLRRREALHPRPGRRAGR